ncbi:TetR/AcrR family transcriptional regulator [Corallincola platygyrae]|uniref:TetR/AcrR family transcriptional regulator n=1 Tax=Corallincola platygyrae TaxID=1193278 RepID=A0ABW4XT99_9GAMM
MSQSREIILNAAERCFFRHGYSAASIAMISRYSEISRVTIHKQFSSKEELFQTVVLQHQKRLQDRLPEYPAKYASVWDAIKALLNDWGLPIFEEISDSLVLHDLVQAAQRYCAKEMEAHRQVMAEFVAECLKQSAEKGEISFSRVGLTAEAIASSLILSIKGLFTSATQEESCETLEQLITIYRTALID